MHATKIHTRDLHFANNAKIYLDEDNEIPRGETNTKHYLSCSSIGYFENYCICHEVLTIWIHYLNNATETTMITPEQIDQNGLLLALSSAPHSIGVSMCYNKQSNGYKDSNSFNDILNISKIESNYYFADETYNTLNQVNLMFAQQIIITLSLLDCVCNSLSPFPVVNYFYLYYSQWQIFHLWV